MAPFGEEALVDEADIGARAALLPVVAGELVPLEEVRVVEDEALRILVRQLAGMLLVRPRDELRLRSERVNGRAERRQERPFVFDADRRHGAADRPRPIEPGGGIVGGDPVHVRLHVGERRDQLPAGPISRRFQLARLVARVKVPATPAK